MKKFLLLLLVFTGFSMTKSNAQFCTPDKTLVDSVVGLSVLFPAPYDTATMMGGFEDTTCIGVYFETALNIVIPETVPFNGTDVPLFNITVTGVTGLPIGLNFACTPQSCVFVPSDTVACINIYGIATEDNIPGDFQLGIEGTANVGFDVPLSLLIDNGAGGYFLFVRPESELSCSGVATENLLLNSMSISNSPNPFSYETVIEIGSEISDEFNFQVFNMLGAVQHHEKVNIMEGRNQIAFDGSHLSEGVYFYTISNHLGQLTGKMMINR